MGQRSLSQERSTGVSSETMVEREMMVEREEGSKDENISDKGNRVCKDSVSQGIVSKLQILCGSSAISQKRKT